MKGVMAVITRLGVLCAALLLAACDGTHLPQVIATYPQRNGGEAQSPIEEVELTLEAGDTVRAAREVVELMTIHRGTVLDESTWRDGRGQHASLTVLVPANQRYGFFKNVRRVGKPLSERTVQSSAGGVTHMRVSIVLIETSTREKGWDPTRTFARALSVFTWLLRMLLDAAIWIVVVAGPFVLMALGLQALLRRARGGRS